MRHHASVRRNWGFTLIELLIVVAIIAILAAIAVPNFLEAQTRSKISRAKADMRTVATALESYRVDNNDYPPSHESITATFLRYRPWAERFKPLTSPIAYLSSFSLCFDVFNYDASNPSNQNPNHFLEGPTYLYVGRESTFKLDPGSAAGIFDNPNSISYGSRWVMTSMGPDGIRQANNLTDPNTQYDPTNGTVSLGDIHRWGP